MGLQNNERGNFISIVKGKIAQRVPEGTVGANTRVTNTGSTVHEKYYDSFVGKLIGVKTKDGNFGKQWFFSFQDHEDIYILALGYESGQAIAILKMLKNCDLSKEMKVSASMSKNDAGIDVTSVFINQDGKAVKHFFTKENPNGLPQWSPVMANGVQVVVNNQKVWDKSAQMNFFEEMVAQDILPKLPKVEEAVGTAPASVPKSQLEEVFGETADDGDEPF